MATEKTGLPLIRTLPGKGAFEALFSFWAHRPYTFRLAGCDGLSGDGRFSYLGIDPYRVVEAKGGSVTAWQGGRATHVDDADPFALLAKEYEPIRRVSARKDLPFAFQGGMMGYLGYGLRRHVEAVPDKGVDDLGLPDLVMAHYDRVLVYDHVDGVAYLVSSGLPLAGREAIRRARARLEEAEAASMEAVAAHPPDGPNEGAHGSSAGGPPGDPQEVGVLSERHSVFGWKEYLQAVLRAKKYIAAGDVYQINLSQRFCVPLACDPERLFRELSAVNPSPFGAYLRGPDWTVVSVSPERFFRYDGRWVETRPIKGTRPRGRDRAEDESLRRELLESAKDRAEHVMIVDLERNDLGRFCRYGSVRVREMMVAEAHPTVWHLVSTVQGVPRDPAGIVSGLRSAFPGGSITGAPKVRAMEIIDELEPVARGVYTGSIGYLGVGGRIDLNIAIRTVVIKEGAAYFHVGGGIVADSDPEAEYEETLDKGRGIARALARVAAGARREGDGASHAP